MVYWLGKTHFLLEHLKIVNEHLPVMVLNINMSRERRCFTAFDELARLLLEFHSALNDKEFKKIVEHCLLPPRAVRLTVVNLTGGLNESNTEKNRTP
ncbi:MAG: hypothetical protein WCY78_03620 [Sphaerochaetaceae bacterium]